MQHLSEYLVLAALITAACACVDYAATRYIKAVQARSRKDAALWSVLQWGAASVGFIVAIKVSLYLLPFEALGLALGSYYGVGLQVSDCAPVVNAAGKPLENIPGKGSGLLEVIPAWTSNESPKLSVKPVPAKSISSEIVKESSESAATSIQKPVRDQLTPADNKASVPVASS